MSNNLSNLILRIETMNKAYILLAEGFEVIEALATIDVMQRGGIECVRVAIGEELNVRSSHGIVECRADLLLSDADLSDGAALILPGGNPGYINLGANDIVREWVRRYYAEGRIVAAICGAPTVLALSDVARGRAITCHSSVREQMEGYDYRGGNVVEDGCLITGAGAGVSVEFALAVAARLTDPETLACIKRGMEFR